MRKNIRTDTNAFFILKIIIVLILISLIICVAFWANSIQPRCPPEDIVEIVGNYQSVIQNGSYWDIQLDNSTYLFNYFDQGYMENLLGYEIKIVACHRFKTVFELEHFDLVYAYIQEGNGDKK